ncbi:hypothetical protein H311_05033, partial [Anncaliia algerae PRA109]
VIWTDEHKIYTYLNNYNFTHESVCHKYEFINHITNINTQTVEYSHNELKLEIKGRKSIVTAKREYVLKEFCFYFTNRKNLYNAVFEKIKI